MTKTLHFISSVVIYVEIWVSEITLYFLQYSLEYLKLVLVHLYICAYLMLISYVYDVFWAS